MKPILNTEEFNILRKYGTWMNALYSGQIDPITHKQKNFCESIRSQNPPIEKYARIFWLYLKRKEIIASTTLSNRKKLTYDDREDWKKIRKMRF